MIAQTVGFVAQAANDIGAELNTKFSALFPTWPTIVATIIAVLILLLVLTKLVYKPVKKMFQERRDYIQNNIDQAEISNKEATGDRQIANEELISARLQAAQIVADARVKAEEVRIVKINKAKEEAVKVVTDAKADMDLAKKQFEQESREAIIDVALEAASKVIEKEADSKVNRKLVADFIENK